jgi:hypothetical protein
MNLLNEVEEFNFDGKKIMSNCVCDQCGKIFDKRGGKERHIKNVHFMPNKYGLNQSKDSIFNNSISVCTSKYENIKVEIDPASIKCEPRDMPCSKVLQQDVMKKVNVFPLKDTIKEEDAFQAKDFNISPLDESQFPCDLCENTLTSQESFDIHKLIHSELNRFVCMEKDCSAIFPNHKSLKKQLKDGPKIEKNNDNIMFHMCQECGKQCTTKAGLQDHMLCHSKEKNLYA